MNELNHWRHITHTMIVTGSDLEHPMPAATAHVPPLPRRAALSHGHTHLKDGTLALALLVAHLGPHQRWRQLEWPLGQWPHRLNSRLPIDGLGPVAGTADPAFCAPRATPWSATGSSHALEREPRRRECRLHNHNRAARALST